MEDGEKNVCSVCKLPAVEKCSGCHAVFYCNEEHKKAHLPVHSEHCKACKFKVGDEIGEHFLATRNIEVGERVLWDKTPLITAPSYMKTFAFDTSTEVRVSSDIDPVCLQCYRKLERGNFKKCAKCGWPLCKSCKEHGPECEFTIKHLKSRELIPTGHTSTRAYAVVGVARALALRENDPISYQTLMKLRDIPMDFRENVRPASYRRNWPDQETVPDFIAETARYALRIFDIRDVEEAEIRKILGIIMVNYHTIKSGTRSHIAVYGLVSYVQHDCRPNCTTTFTKTGEIIFAAVLPILKGDQITITYINPFMLPQDRKNEVFARKFIPECTCKRCKDPTEFDSMYTARWCHEKGCGREAFPKVLFPHRNSMVYYVCGTCSKILDTVMEYRKKWDVEKKGDTLIKDSLYEYRAFVRDRTRVFHENHHYIVDVELRMIREFIEQSTHQNLWYKSREEVDEIVYLCVKLTNLLKIIAPAETKMRASILYLKFRVTRVFDQKNRFPFTQSVERCKGYLKDLKEIIPLLQFEPEDSEQYSMLQKVRELINELEVIEQGWHTVPVDCNDVYYNIDQIIR